MNRLAFIGVLLLMASAIILICSLGSVPLFNLGMNDLIAVGLLFFMFGFMFEWAGRYVYFRCPKCNWYGGQKEDE